MRLSEGLLAIIEGFFLFDFLKLESLVWFGMFAFEKNVNQIAYANEKALQWVGNFPVSNRAMSYIWHNYGKILL